MAAIVLLCGYGGSGKDYVLDKVCKENEIVGKKVLSYTTRSPRFDGESTHTFIDDDFYNKCKESGEIIAYTYQNNAHYFTTPESIRDKKFYIIDKPGIEFFLEYYKNNKQKLLDVGIDRIMIVYLKLSKIKIAYNLLFRRKLSIKNTIKRMWQDYNLYKGMENIDGVRIFKDQKTLELWLMMGYVTDYYKF